MMTTLDRTRDCFTNPGMSGAWQQILQVVLDNASDVTLQVGSAFFGDPEDPTDEAHFSWSSGDFTFLVGVKARPETQDRLVVLSAFRKTEGWGHLMPVGEYVDDSHNEIGFLTTLLDVVDLCLAQSKMTR